MVVVEVQVRCGRIGQARTRSPEGAGEAGAPAGPVSRAGPAGRAGAMAELGDEPEVAAGSRRVWGRRRAASHLNDVAAVPYFPRPLPIRPPTRPLAAGCCEAALPGPDRERQCLPARHSPRVSPPPQQSPLPPLRPPRLASLARRRRAQWRRREKGCGPAAPRRALDDAAPASTPSTRSRSR